MELPVAKNNGKSIKGVVRSQFILEQNGIKTIETEKLYIPIPSGVDNNEIIKLEQKGNMLDTRPFHVKNAKKCKQKELPKLGIAPRLPRPQRGVLLLDYFGGWRQMEDPGIDPGSQPCEGCMLPCTTIPQTNCVHRDSNPNLILGRDKYYPCTCLLYTSDAADE